MIDAVGASRGDLGVFRLDQGASAGAWWRGLAGEGRPKIIARLPFIERPDHPAGTPVFVISKPLADAAVRDVVLYGARVERWRDTTHGAIADCGVEVVASVGTPAGLSVLLAAPGSLGPTALGEAIAATGTGPSDLVEVGSHAERFRVP